LFSEKTAGASPHPTLKQQKKAPQREALRKEVPPFFFWQVFVISQND